MLLSEPYVEYLLAKYGFRVLAKEYFKDDHSIFYRAVRDLEVLPLSLNEDLYQLNYSLYFKYIEHYKKLTSKINQEINNTEGPVYLFGAHVFSQYLIAFGLNEDRITALLDNDVNKHGKRLSGTSLSVFSPNILAQIEKPKIILRAGAYNDEIKADIINNINVNAIFI